MSKFTPSSAIDYSKEKEWAPALGMLDWDTTSIVFTKRSLIEFLKYTGTTVDTNFSNISKTPRYAKIGTFSPELGTAAAEAATSEVKAQTAASDTFIPTRRVRTVPGGPHTDIFGSDFQEEGDALSQAPSRPDNAAPAAPAQPASTTEEEEEPQGINFSSNFVPTRRVRENPGGNSTLSNNFWGSDEPEAFVPTRRVREGPGGADHISSIF